MCWLKWQTCFPKWGCVRDQCHSPSGPLWAGPGSSCPKEWTEFSFLSQMPSRTQLPSRCRSSAASVLPQGPLLEKKQLFYAGAEGGDQGQEDAGNCRLQWWFSHGGYCLHPGQGVVWPGWQATSDRWHSAFSFTCALDSRSANSQGGLGQAWNISIQNDASLLIRGSF